MFERLKFWHLGFRVRGFGVYDLGFELIGGRDIVQQSLWKSGTDSIINKNLHLSY